MAVRREDLRVADVDRGFVADRLKAALDEGRLSLSEYDERLGLAYAAKTYGDLDHILKDLPGVLPPQQSQLAHPAAPTSPAPAAAAAPAPAVGPPAGARRSTPRWLLAIWQAWLLAVSINVVIWLLVCLSTGKFIYFWPMWVGGPWGAILLIATISRMASGEPETGPQGPPGAPERGLWAERYDRRTARFERRAQRRAQRRGSGA